LGTAVVRATSNWYPFEISSEERIIAMKKTRTTFFVAAVLALSACGSSSDQADTTDPDVDTPVVAGLCTQDQPDCDDTGFIDAPSPSDSDSNDVDTSDDVAIVDGMAIDGGLSVEEALDTEATGVVAVKGYLLDDATGLRLCSVLAESFPPQCGGTSLTIAGFDSDRMIELPEYELVQVESSGGVTWTDGHVTLFGDINNGNLSVAELTAG
jgi:hypothetical protein